MSNRRRPARSGVGLVYVVAGWLACRGCGRRVRLRPASDLYCGSESYECPACGRIGLVSGDLLPA